MDALQTSSLQCWSQERLGSMSHQHMALTGLPGEDLVTWHAAVASYWVSITSLNLVSFHCKYFPWLQLTAFRRLTENKLNFSSPTIVTQTSAIINARPLPRNDWALKMSNMLLFMSGQKAAHKHLQNVSILRKKSLTSVLISEWKRPKSENKIRILKRKNVDEHDKQVFTDNLLRPPPWVRPPSPYSMVPLICFLSFLHNWSL